MLTPVLVKEVEEVSLASGWEVGEVVLSYRRWRGESVRV